MSAQDYYGGGGGGGGYPPQPQPVRTIQPFHAAHLELLADLFKSYGGPQGQHPPQGSYYAPQGPPQGPPPGQYYPQQQPPMQYQQAPPQKQKGGGNCLTACLAALCCCCVLDETCECWYVSSSSSSPSFAIPSTREGASVTRRWRIGPTLRAKPKRAFA